MIVLVTNCITPRMWYSECIGHLFNAFEVPECDAYFVSHEYYIEPVDAYVVTRKSHRMIDEVRNILLAWRERIENREAQKQASLKNPSFKN